MTQVKSYEFTRRVSAVIDGQNPPYSIHGPWQLFDVSK